eukprot:scaffold4641_cov117-Isochrysis_galbana.AAC.10
MSAEAPRSRVSSPHSQSGGLIISCFLAFFNGARSAARHHARPQPLASSHISQSDKSRLPRELRESFRLVLDTL